MSKGHDCKCKEVECEECPEWIFTLADLIMCMMGLFVILWVLKPGPKDNAGTLDGDWIKVVAAIREQFGYIPDPKSSDPKYADPKYKDPKADPKWDPKYDPKGEDPGPWGPFVLTTNWPY